MALGVVATTAALVAIEALVRQQGPVMFFQSGGCCDCSLPMCFADGEFIVGDHDILLGIIGGCPFYIDHRQYEAWKHTQLIVDVARATQRGSASRGREQALHHQVAVFGTDELASRKDGYSPEAGPSSQEVPPRFGITATSSTVIFPSWEALSADARPSAHVFNRWIED